MMSRATVNAFGKAAFQFVFLSVLMQPFPADAEEENNLLTSTYTREFISKHLIPRNAWKPFPPARERSAWSAQSNGGEQDSPRVPAPKRSAWSVLENNPLNRRRKAYVTEAAEALSGKPWPALPATLYMEFVRTGNRSNYQDHYFQRRKNLSTLVLAECMEYKGRFLDEIANGIWALCEESSWCLPAHATRLKGDVLHKPGTESLDLFACETAMSLAQIHYLLRKELDALSPALCIRIEQEVGRRILEPYASGDDFNCSGWINGYNNWSPWCASNVMGAAMYLEKDHDRLAAVVYRLMGVVDRFINRYGSDGGCDEGPSYWNEAAGAMLVFLELLHSRTGGAVDIYDHPKTAAMGRFIIHAHLAGQWFANFADADPHSHPHPGKVYRFGERIHCSGMKNLALLSMRNWDIRGTVKPPVRISGVARAVLGPLMELFWIPPEATPEATPEKPVHEVHVWYPDLQVLFAREGKAPQKGLILASKGGHNAESHNHNDIGHFILFLDGQPCIVDIGRETYTRQTFSSKRYDLWFTRALAHNAPVVNGIEQHAGHKYRAANIRCRQKGLDSILSMHLEKAYPAEAELDHLRRTLTLHRGDGAKLTVCDAYKSSSTSPVFFVRLYTPQQIKKRKPGQLSLLCSPRRLLLSYDPAEMRASVKQVPLDDRLLRKSWGRRLYRIDLTLKKHINEGSYTFTFAPQPAR